MRSRSVWLLTGLAAFASANGVMGVALEQYDARAWLAYVVLTVIFEAWALGRWAGFTWPRAVGVSLAANFVTAGCCANLCGVGLHGTFVGSRLNPNPFMNMLVVFGGFALISGAIESVVWRLFDLGRDDRVRGYAWSLRSLAAHLVWVPLGMAIMLIPARPYPYLERYTLYARYSYMRSLCRALEAKIEEKEQIPDYRDTTKFLRELVPLYGPPLDAWAAAYRPAFARFATGESRRELLWEWNPAASGLKTTSARMPETVWLIRIKPSEGERFGLVWNRGWVSSASDPALLGYAAAPSP